MKDTQLNSKGATDSCGVFRVLSDLHFAHFVFIYLSFAI